MDLEVQRLIVQLGDRIAGLPNSRNKSTALTKLDECEMWLKKEAEEREPSDERDYRARTI